MIDIMEYVRADSKALIDKYPWLCPERNEDGSIASTYDYSYTELDFVPNGWRNIAMDLCEEIRSILKPLGLLDKYMLSEVKEKWSMLGWYDYMVDLTPIPKDIDEAVHRAEERSKFVCFICGAPKEPTQEVCNECAYKLGWTNTSNM